MKSPPVKADGQRKAVGGHAQPAPAASAAQPS